MDPSTILGDTLGNARHMMSDTLASRRVRALAVLKLRDLLWSPEVAAALAVSSDNCLAFAVRESRAAFADTPAQPDKVLTALRAVLDDPDLDAAIRLARSSHLKGHRNSR
jgi:hypothetical protein